MLPYIVSFYRGEHNFEVGYNFMNSTIEMSTDEVNNFLNLKYNAILVEESDRPSWDHIEFENEIDLLAFILSYSN